MYEQILVAIDASPDSPDDSLHRTIQFAKMTGGSVHLLHVARGHVVAADINAGSGFGVLAARTTSTLRERQVVQDAVTSWPPRASPFTANSSMRPSMTSRR